MSPLLAQSGHAGRGNECPLLGVKQTSGGRASMSAYDLKRTSAPLRHGKVVRPAAWLPVCRAWSLALGTRRQILGTGL